tara:strand:+ start:2345 stop:3466 length:1122 start_codon:yes stop_codon:yes gene_type:complete
MHEDNNNSPLNIREESIDDIIISILNKIWKGRNLIKNTIIIFFIIGCAKALLSPIVYESQTTFIPQTSDQNSSNNKGYAQLASLAGINLNAESISSLDNYISPLLYYKITESDEFSLDILNEELTFIDGSKSTVKEYILSMSNNILAKIIGFIKKYTIGLFSQDLKNETHDGNFPSEYNFINDDDYNIIKAFQKKFTIELNKKEGYVKVLAYDRDAFISTQLVKLVTKNLQSRIISLRTNKIKEQLEYTEVLYKQKRDEFEKLQMTLAEFKDSNKSISTSVFLSKLQMLQSEFDLQKSILTSLASEFNNNKIKLNKDTPIFSVIDEVSVPNVRSEPRRKIIVITYLIAGIFLSILYLLTKETFIELIRKIKKV